MVRQVLAVDEEAPTPVHRLAYACAEDPAHAPPPTLVEETLLEDEIRPRPRRGAPRGARRGARRGDAAEVVSRGGAHQPEARGGVIIPLLRSPFLFLADTPSPRPRHRRDTND